MVDDPVVFCAASLLRSSSSSAAVSVLLLDFPALLPFPLPVLNIPPDVILVSLVVPLVVLELPLVLFLPASMFMISSME